MSLLRAPESDEIILDRLFFALKPSTEAASEIAEVRGKVGGAKSHVDDHRLHLSLWSLDLPMMPPPGIIADLCRGAAAVRAPMLRVVLQEVVGDRSVTYLKPGEPTPVLKDFQRRLQLAIADVGIFPNRGFRFDPHVTLAYGQDEAFRHQLWPISWRADAFVLIHSLVGLTEHRELGRWMLG